MKSLLELSHQLGNPARPLAILGEGNASARLGHETFLVKASGCNLLALDRGGVVECRAKTLLPLLEKTHLSDAEIDGTLLASRVEAGAKKPSLEVLFHAWLLTLPEIEFVGHAHAPAVNSILCSPRAREFAEKRIFPDEILCCDVASVLVRYTDLGLKLAQAIRTATNGFIHRLGRPPRVILIENHGIITLGRSVEAVLSAMLMAEKAAGIWLGAAALGGPRFLTPEDVARISNRPDEEVRRRMLNL
ncbi:MAG TPA: class II aldolase/adducin family protein [Verrucomicrobiae bacterium]|nr:class II aldolase/adducin family protein [Verrucomicrobiae bacterium]